MTKNGGFPLDGNARWRLPGWTPLTGALLALCLLVGTGVACAHPTPGTEEQARQPGGASPAPRVSDRPLSNFLGLWSERWADVDDKNSILIEEGPGGQPKVTMVGKWRTWDAQFNGRELSFRVKGGDANWEFLYRVESGTGDTLRLHVHRVHDNRDFDGELYGRQEIFDPANPTGPVVPLSRFVGLWNERWGDIDDRDSITVVEGPGGKPTVTMAGKWRVWDERFDGRVLSFRVKGGDSDWEFFYACQYSGPDRLQLKVHRVHDNRDFYGELWGRQQVPQAGTGTGVAAPLSNFVGVWSERWADVNYHGSITIEEASPGRPKVTIAGNWRVWEESFDGRVLRFRKRGGDSDWEFIFEITYSGPQQLKLHVHRVHDNRDFDGELYERQPLPGSSVGAGTAPTAPTAPLSNFVGVWSERWADVNYHGSITIEEASPGRPKVTIAGNWRVWEESFDGRVLRFRKRGGDSDWEFIFEITYSGPQQLKLHVHRLHDNRDFDGELYERQPLPGSRAGAGTAPAAPISNLVGMWSERWADVDDKNSIVIEAGPGGQPKVTMVGNWRTWDAQFDGRELSFRVKGGDSNWEFLYRVESGTGDTLRLHVHRVHDNRDFDGELYGRQAIGPTGRPSDTTLSLANASREPRKDATLEVVGHPGGAELYVDNELKGTTGSEGQLKVYDLPPGEHQVRLVRKGYGEWARTVTLTAGETHVIEVQLTEAAPETALALVDVLRLLERGVTAVRMETIVKDRGVSFALTEEAETRLRDAGATPALLLAIAKAKK